MPTAARSHTDANQGDNVNDVFRNQLTVSHCAISSFSELFNELFNRSKPLTPTDYIFWGQQLPKGPNIDIYRYILYAHHAWDNMQSTV